MYDYGSEDFDPPKQMTMPKDSTEILWHVYWDQDYWAAEAQNAPGLSAGAITLQALGEAMEDAASAWIESDPISGGGNHA